MTAQDSVFVPTSPGQVFRRRLRKLMPAIGIFALLCLPTAYYATRPGRPFPPGSLAVTSGGKGGDYILAVLSDKGDGGVQPARIPDGTRVRVLKFVEKSEDFRDVEILDGFYVGEKGHIPIYFLKPPG